jgi:anti-sigma-K factor RskA
MSTPHSARHDELIRAHAAGELEGDDLRELEAHLATGCAECRQQLDLWQGDVEKLAASVPAIEPSTLTRERILRRTGVRQQPVRRAPLLRWLAIPAAALLAVCVVWAGGRQARLGAEVERLRAERDLLERQVAALDRELNLARSEAQRMAATLAILSTPGARSVRLAGLGPTPGALGETFLDPRQGRAVFWAFHLPSAEPGRTYQLWWIGSAGPVSAGTFDVDARGQGRLEVGRVERPGDIQAWAVTVEPAGGVPQPTGAMVLKG